MGSKKSESEMMEKGAALRMNEEGRTSEVNQLLLQEGIALATDPKE